MTKQEARAALECSRTTLYRYIVQATEHGVELVSDKRHGNNYKISLNQEKALVNIKKQGGWRSARKALELTGINTISSRRVQQIWVKHNLHRENVERLKPIVRFVAKYPNDLWQADIMGKIHFPYLGDAYLIANIDDHSRFILGGKWFSSQTQMNVFRVWYHCLFVWGLPKTMLSDKGTQYKSTNPKGEATYQFYARTLGIELKWAPRARTKGKIEKFWRFVQQDFVREYLQVKSFAKLNHAFFTWQVKYNEEFKHSGIGMNGRTPAEVYQPSERRRPKQELQELLTITLRRLVYRDSTISLFGKRYKVPNQYITCRIWVRIKGETVRVESMGRVVYKFRLRA